MVAGNSKSAAGAQSLVRHGYKKHTEGEAIVCAVTDPARAKSSVGGMLSTIQFGADRRDDRCEHGHAPRTRVVGERGEGPLEAVRRRRAEPPQRYAHVAREKRAHLADRRLEVDRDLAEAEDHQAEVTADERLQREAGAHVERGEGHGALARQGRGAHEERRGCI